MTEYIKHPGFYISIEDLNHLERVMGLLADFVAIVVDQQVQDLDNAINEAKRELALEKELY